MERHLIISGHGRAGSTLFYTMMRHCLRDFGVFEAEMPTAQLLHLPGNQCSKRPYDIFDTARILQANRRGKQLDLIVMLRDPRDILISRHRAVPDDYFMAADLCYFIQPGKVPTFTAPGLLQIQRAIMQVARSGAFPRGIFYLKYEDLVADPDSVQQALAAQLGLRFEGSFADFHTAEIPAHLQGPLNGVRALEAGPARKWAEPEHRARIIDQFTRFPVLHDVLIGLGYETDRSWYDALLAEGRGVGTGGVGNDGGRPKAP
ncbi:sulfotransferase [Maritimibacter alkaliphilus]|uniref:sulfotransferase n=1 Tax=Maritimibacter alkaliphilus TaxID=404236 RepID=UPI001C964565|nr:sulfotransferase [Maritimibacter alkaliphilus]MBY6090222.1 sulfotransferase [Maritimibacter alkaliphilus]